jgi:hypothetical protein
LIDFDRAVESVTPAVPAIQPVQPAQAMQPALLGFEGALAPETAATERAPRAAARRAPRHRYWSVRDLARRIWFGRGYELLRELIRTGVLPATRSARSWWIDDADVQGLLAAFDARAGKVRAFHRLDAWLRERCRVMPATPELDQVLRATRSGFTWRGTAYLPKQQWHVETADDGQVVLRHPSSGLVVPQPLTLLP